MTALTDGHIFVGNSSNIATDVAMSGDATIDNTGAVTVTIALGDLADVKTNYGNNNMLLGQGAGAALTSGQDNTGLGENVMTSLTSGGDNTGLGLAALQNLTTGSFNIAIGPAAALAITTGQNNIAIGGNSLSNAATSTSDNVVVGHGAATSIVSGDGNVCVGTAANIANGKNYSVAIGYDAVASSNNSLCIGANAGVGSGITNAAAIGYQANVTSSNTVQIGNSSVTAVNFGASGTTLGTNLALGGSPTTTTQSAGDNSTKIATTAYVNTAASDSGLGMSDITTNNVTSAKHGFAPKSPADATKFLNGDTTPAYAQVKDSDLSTSDITTNNSSSTKHGFSPKSPADATQFLNGAATPAYAQVKDSDLSTSDITTNNVSTSKHGFAPKLPNDATKYLDGTGSYTVPPAGAVVLLGSATASSSSTLDFTSLISATYSSYFWTFDTVKLSSSAVELQLRVSTNNSTFISTTSYAWMNNEISIANTPVQTQSGNTSDDSIQLVHSSGFSGLIYGVLKFNSTASSNIQFFDWNLNVGPNSGNKFNVTGTGYNTTTSGIQAVRFLVNAGSISSGTIRMYGIVAS